MTTVEKVLQSALENHQAGDLVTAMRLYHNALELNPQHAEVWNLVGVLAQQIGKQDVAIENIQRAISLDDNVADYHLNLATSLLADNQLEQAEASCHACLTLRPDCSQARVLLGDIYAEQGRFQLAAESFREVLQQGYSESDAEDEQRANLNGIDATTERDLRERGAKVEGTYRDDASTTTTSQWPIIFHEADSRYAATIELWIEALEAGRTTLDQIAAQCHIPVETIIHAVSCWYFEIGETETAKRIAKDCLDQKSDPLMHSQYLRCLMASPSATKKQFFQESLHWASCYGHEQQTVPDAEFRNYDLSPNKRLRLGFLCGYANTSLFQAALAPLLKHLDRTDFEVLLFNLGESSRKWVVQCADECIDFLLLDHETLYQEIKNRKVDLLIDLNGRFRLDNPIKVIQRRPAPVQVTYGNMLGTYGLEAVKYILADPYALLPEDDKYYSENIFRFESGDGGTFDIPRRPIRSMPFKQSGVFTFGSFNALFKMNDSVLTAWARILQRVPNSQLLIKANGVHSRRFRERILDTVSKYVARHTDVMLEPFSEFDLMLDTYNKVDLGLNTFPYSGGTTIAFALWMGVPSVTLESTGEGMVSGGAGGLLRSPGYDEFVVGSIDEYVERAVELANNPEHLEELRMTMRQRLLDTARFNPPMFAADFGKQCRAIWQHWLENAEISEGVRSP